MMPLALAAAFGAAKFNELRFSDLNKSWQDQRIFDRMRCSLDLSWFYEQISTHQPALAGRLRTLQAQKAVGVQQCLDLHKEIPFAHFPTRLIANVKRSWTLRSHFRDVNREIDAARCGTGPRLITGRSHGTKSANLVFKGRSDGESTFLAQQLINWSLPRSSDFRLRTFEACIAQFRTPQLDELNAQMNLLYSRAVERVWGQMIRGSEKIVTAMALLQIGFSSSIPLSIGSSILAFCSKRSSAHVAAKVFMASGRFFGIGGLAFALAMGLAVHRYSRLLQRGKERIDAIDKVKELMWRTIECVRQQRFRDTLELGRRAQEQHDEIFESHSRHLARNDEKLAWADRTFAELRARSAEEALRIENQREKLDRHKKGMAELAEGIRTINEKLSAFESTKLVSGLKAHMSKFAEQKSKLTDTRGELEAHKSKFIEQESKLEQQNEALRALLERLNAFENSQLTRAG